jgi:hypothetical protein
MGSLFGGGKKKAPPPPPAAPPEPVGVTRAQQLAASKLRSRPGGRDDGSRSLMSGSRLGPGPGEYETRGQIIERTKDTLG